MQKLQHKKYVRCNTITKNVIQKQFYYKQFVNMQNNM